MAWREEDAKLSLMINSNEMKHEPHRRRCSDNYGKEDGSKNKVTRTINEGKESFIVCLAAAQRDGGGFTVRMDELTGASR